MRGLIRNFILGLLVIFANIAVGGSAQAAPMSQSDMNIQTDESVTQTKLIALKSTLGGLWVRAGVTENAYLAAQSKSATDWELFWLVSQGNGNVALQSFQNKKYVFADNSVNYRLTAGASAVGSSETFKLIDRGGGKVALQLVETGKYVRAGSTEASYLAAVSDTILGWETFELKAVSPVRCTPGKDRVTLYQDANFQGPCDVYPVGDYPRGLSVVIPNDNLSSIQNNSPDSTLFYLCEHKDFGGKCELRASSDPNLGDNLVGNDSVSSIRVFHADQPVEPCLGDLWSLSETDALQLLQDAPVADYAKETIRNFYDAGFATVVFFDKSNFNQQDPDAAYWVFPITWLPQVLEPGAPDFFLQSWKEDKVESILYLSPTRSRSALQIFDDRKFSAPNCNGCRFDGKDRVKFCGSAAVDNLNGSFDDVTDLGNNQISSFRFLDIGQHRPCGGLINELSYSAIGINNSAYWPACDYWGLKGGTEITVQIKDSDALEPQISLIQPSGQMMTTVDGTFARFKIPKDSAGSYGLRLTSSRFGRFSVTISDITPPPPGSLPQRWQVRLPSIGVGTVTPGNGGGNTRGKAGVDCGCAKTGDFAIVKAEEVKDGKSKDGKYRVEESAFGVVVTRIADNKLVLNLPTIATIKQYGFGVASRTFILATTNSLIEPVTVTLWDVESGENLLQTVLPSSGGWAFSPDGRTALVAGKNSEGQFLTVVNIESRQTRSLQMRTLDWAEWSFSPCGDVLATAFADESTGSTSINLYRTLDLSDLTSGPTFITGNWPGLTTTSSQYQTKQTPPLKLAQNTAGVACTVPKD